MRSRFMNNRPPDVENSTLPGGVVAANFRRALMTMVPTDIRNFYNKHCRFKLRNGKEVYGVIWEVDSNASHRLFFASVSDYERFQHDPEQPIAVIPMPPDEIVLVESLAS